MYRNHFLIWGAVLAFTGCSAGGSEPPVGSTSPDLVFVDPSAISAQVYVGGYTYPSATPIRDYKAGDKSNKKYFCEIHVGEAVNAIDVDGSGELWVPQYDPTVGASDVVSFAPSCGKQGTTLSDPDGQAAGIAFDSKGVAYVDNVLGPSSSAGNVAVYPKGKTSPTSELTNADIFLAAGVGIDSKGNAYVSFFSNPTSTTGVLEFDGGKMPGKLLKAVRLQIPGVPLFDSKDNLLITDDANSAPVEDVYAPPYSKKPKTFALKGNSPQCSLDEAQSTLACGDKQNTSIDFYSYPAGKYLYSVNKGLTGSIIGVAQDPT